MKMSYALISTLVLSTGMSSLAFAKKKKNDEEGRSSRCAAIGGIYFYGTNGAEGTCEGDWDSNDNVITRGKSGSSTGKSGSGSEKSK